VWELSARYLPFDLQSYELGSAPQGDLGEKKAFSSFLGPLRHLILHHNLAELAWQDYGGQPDES
jgi:hypothetical protein